MLEIFMYPVSGIMKLWHLLLSLFMADTTAWLISIVLLVLTIRLLISPLNWISVRTGRIGALIRPQSNAIMERRRAAKDVDELMAADADLKALHAEHNFRPGLGCLPPLIMLPVFIGLYQVLLRMARPSASEQSNIGLLNAEEIAAFRTAEFNGIPLPAFMSMPQEWAASLGVTGEQVREVMTPWLIAAIVFTVVNLIIAIYRLYLTTQFDTAIGRRLFYMMVGFVFFVPLMLWSIATHGPIPSAIILYWACTNLFTLIQTIVFEVILRTRYPLNDSVHEMRRESIKNFRAPKEKLTRSEKKDAKKERRERNRELNKLMIEARKRRKEFATGKKSESTEAAPGAQTDAPDNDLPATGEETRLPRPDESGENRAD